MDIPAAPAEATEDVLEHAACPGCGEIACAALPEGVPSSVVGPRLRAVLAMLTGRFRLSRREVQAPAVDRFGEKARIGTLSALERRAAEAIASAYREAARALCRDLLRRFPSLFTFTRRPGVPPTNSLAERELRPAVLRRKGSFGCRSERGERFVEAMLTVVRTLRRQGRNLLDFPEASIRAALRGTRPPRLRTA